MDAIYKFIIAILCCHLSCAYLKLSITPLEKHIFLKENEDLNLTCKLSVPDNLKNKFYLLSWTLPIKKSNIENRVFIHEGYNERSVTIHKLRENDSGEYRCEVNDSGIIRYQKVNIHVKTAFSGKGTCSKPMFSCETGLCIPLNYVCDGFKDCLDGSDESIPTCGLDACKGKFVCDGRCISTKLCCDVTVDPNCSANYLMPCCSRLFAKLPLDMPIVGVDGNIPVQYKYHNFGFYQSTVYTMISCAVAFIFMSTVMLVAVCRFRTRQASWFFPSSRPNQGHQFWQRPSATQNARQTTLTNLHSSTRNQDQSEMLDPLENFVLLTFDSETGFEIAEYGPKPPPYTENNIGIPPPPYSSMVDIAAENQNDATRLPSQNESSENNATSINPPVIPGSDNTPPTPVSNSTRQP